MHTNEWNNSVSILPMPMVIEIGKALEQKFPDIKFMNCIRQYNPAIDQFVIKFKISYKTISIYELSMSLNAETSVMMSDADLANFIMDHLVFHCSKFVEQSTKTPESIVGSTHNTELKAISKKIQSPLLDLVSKNYSSLNTSLQIAFPALVEMVECPACKGPSKAHKPNTLNSAIIILNDTHKWTREQIADWLETLDIDIEYKGV